MLARDAGVARLVAPVVEQLEVFAREIATTWRTYFRRKDDITIVDHRGAVLGGKLDGERIAVTQLEKWVAGTTNGDRAGRAEKSLR